MSMEEVVSEGVTVKEHDQSMLLKLRSSYQSAPHYKSHVKRWMTENYDGFSATLGVMFPNGRMNWVWLTEWFQENGFRNLDGSDLKKHTVKEYWRRVVEEKSKVGG